MKNEKLDEIMKKRGISVVAQDDGTDRKVPPSGKRLRKTDGDLLYSEKYRGYGDSLLVQPCLVGK